jgi:hypothetical protein
VPQLYPNSELVRLKKLDDVNVRKLQALLRWDHDTHDAILWLRENRNKFKMEVFEPPLMVLTVPDRRFVNAVESCFNAPQLKAKTWIRFLSSRFLISCPFCRRSSHSVKRTWTHSITTSTIRKLLAGRRVSLPGIALGKKICFHLHL